MFFQQELVYPESSPLSEFSVVIAVASMGGNEGGGGRGGERWSLFSVRPMVQKSPTDPGSETNTPGRDLLYAYNNLM